jgi:hypothetical protein
MCLNFFHTQLSTPQNLISDNLLKIIPFLILFCKRTIGTCIIHKKQIFVNELYAKKWLKTYVNRARYTKDSPFPVASLLLKGSPWFRSVVRIRIYSYHS